MAPGFYAEAQVAEGLHRYFAERDFDVVAQGNQRL